MSTPEGAVKRQISKLLKSYGPELWYDMPVPGGFGKSMLDYQGVYMGRPFAIEAKRPGGVPTPRQCQIMETMQAAGIQVFLVDGPDMLAKVRSWLNFVKSQREQTLADLLKPVPRINWNEM